MKSFQGFVVILFVQMPNEKLSGGRTTFYEAAELPKKQREI